MGNRLDHLSQRLVYENAVNILGQAGVSTTIAKLTPSSLRFEQQLSTANALYTFPVTVTDQSPNGNAKTPTEVRLDQQNAFVASEMSYYLAEPASYNDPTYIDCSYPSPAIFATGGEAAALGVMYHGFLKLTVNNNVLIPSLYTSRFRYVPTAQQVTAAANQNGIAHDGINMIADAMMICEPNIYFIGSKLNLLQLFLPASPTVIGAAGFTRAIIEVHGLLAQNVTVVT